MDGQLIYIVQDAQQRVVHVSSTLHNAVPAYKRIIEDPLLIAQMEQLEEDEGQIDYPPCIVVHQVDGHFVWSYDCIKEITDALTHGEQYD